MTKNTIFFYHKKIKGYILLEFVLGLVVVSVLLTIFMNFVFTEIKDNQRHAIRIEISQQHIFAQNYLQQLANEATQILIVGETLVVSTGSKTYTVGMRKNSLYVKQKAYRYLTIPPFKLESLVVEEINENLFQLKMLTKKKSYEILMYKKK